MKPLTIQRFTFGKLRSNSYAVTDEETFCIVIDPGENPQSLLAYIRNRKVDYILLTHGHYDHIAGVDEVRRATDASVVIHQAEADYLIDPKLNLSFGNEKQIKCEWPDILLNGNELVKCGELSVKVIHTPGHSPGSVSYLLNDEYLFSGDALLAGLIGPTDLPFGNRGQLKTSIREKLFTLPDEVAVYPGHGEATDIGIEKETNQFPNMKSFY
ncbi:MBL fold metallo-hydrolase [Planococcus ruber]|uniref:MBL fold metallo-hydrolase n=1 Tax=Planococcus ruber TaxID=2027871 RepID=UPI001FEED9C0|nr:MBL fold metallo-hydrolase [Planococcus ruber]MCJ1907977.1 MBL fold metallo-hydrolase [Planococcus ruber]